MRCLFSGGRKMKNQVEDFRSDLKDVLEESTRCGICFEMFCYPHRCGCGHTFCGLCLSKWINEEKSSCPTCRQQLFLVQVDWGVSNLLEAFAPRLLDKAAMTDWQARRKKWEEEKTSILKDWKEQGLTSLPRRSSEEAPTRLHTGNSYRSFLNATSATQRVLSTELGTSSSPPASPDSLPLIPSPMSDSPRPSVSPLVGWRPRFHLPTVDSLELYRPWANNGNDRNDRNENQRGGGGGLNYTTSYATSSSTSSSEAGALSTPRSVFGARLMVRREDNTSLNSVLSVDVDELDLRSPRDYVMDMFGLENLGSRSLGEEQGPESSAGSGNEGDVDVNEDGHEVIDLTSPRGGSTVGLDDEDVEFSESELESGCDEPEENENMSNNEGNDMEPLAEWDGRRLHDVREALLPDLPQDWFRWAEDVSNDHGDERSESGNSLNEIECDDDVALAMTSMMMIEALNVDNVDNEEISNLPDTEICDSDTPSLHDTSSSSNTQGSSM